MVTVIFSLIDCFQIIKSKKNTRQIQMRTVYRCEVDTLDVSLPLINHWEYWHLSEMVDLVIDHRFREDDSP